MWPFIKPIKLIRYLFVWRVNGSMVRLPRCLSAEISLVLGTTIANRLPTRQASPWHKALAPWEAYGGISLAGKKFPKKPPEASWPIEAVLFVYPGKLTYGRGELIFCEFKLLGEDADHGFFLEVILPALEDAGSVSNPQWQRTNTLWGRFDVHAVYAARGPRWEPVVSDGQLNLQYRATPIQWAEGLTFGRESEHTFNRLTWQTPFDLGSDANISASRRRRRSKKQIPSDQAPTLQRILESLTARMSALLPGKHHTPDQVLNVLSAEERESFQTIMEQAARIPIHRASYEPAPKYWPGRWIGTQNFPVIPRPIIPYLELASILHIGKQTHFGCGAFMID